MRCSVGGVIMPTLPDSISRSVALIEGYFVSITYLTQQEIFSRRVILTQQFRTSLKPMRNDPLVIVKSWMRRWKGIPESDLDKII